MLLVASRVIVLYFHTESKMKTATASTVSNFDSLIALIILSISLYDQRAADHADLKSKELDTVCKSDSEQFPCIV